MKKTSVGLPNTCYQCGQLAEPHWYAPNEDAARAGAGICESCQHPAPKQAPKPAKDPDPPAVPVEESAKAELVPTEEAVSEPETKTTKGSSSRKKE